MSSDSLYWTYHILTDVKGRKVVEHRVTWAQSSSGTTLARLSGSGTDLLCSACVGFSRVGLPVRLGRQFGSRG